MENRLIVNKIIYAKRVNITKDQVLQILDLEVNTHLCNNRDLIFVTVGKVLENKDKSQTYPLIFIVKPQV
jgi:hypothetical protein